MNAYDELIKEERAEALEQGIEKGISIGKEIAFTEKERQVVTNILQAFPEWDDEKIADIASSSVETIVSIRTELGL